MSQKNTKQKYHYISYLNVISAVAVVMMHANSSFWNYNTKAYWGVTNVIENTCFFAVPIFFMLTGATLMDYNQRYSTKEFFKKRFFKTVIPFLFWSVFGMFWASRKVLWAMAEGAPNKGLDWTVGAVINGIVNSKFVQIYWFFIPLFCIYLMIPVLAAIPEPKRTKIFTYIIGVSLVLNYTIPFVLGILKHYIDFTMSWTLTMSAGLQYMIYPLIGYVLSKTEFKRKHRMIIYALAIAGLLTMIIGTYYTTRRAGKLIGVYKGYYNVPVLLYASGIFLFVKKAAERVKSEKVNRAFAYLQTYTFPVYLIHRYFLDVFEENIGLIHVEKASLLYVFGAAAAALLLSVLVTWILRKIPVLRHIVP